MCEIMRNSSAVGVHVRVRFKKQSDVTKTGNGERGMGNGERESGNKCTAVTRLRIQNGGGNDVYKHDKH